ncbi:MAG: phospholipase D-like domain-containing protein, partial [Candidatus Limnocylindria bacterium]
MDHRPELEIVKQILKGSTDCYFAIFTFAGSSGIDDALLAMARGGMQIRGVLDRGQANQQWAAPKWLKHENIRLYLPRKAGGFATLRKLHHKLMVIDERIVVAGSYNYTEPANLYHDGNIFVLGSTHAEVAGVEVEVSPTRQLARFFKSEIERIIALSEPYEPLETDGPPRGAHDDAANVSAASTSGRTISSPPTWPVRTRWRVAPGHAWARSHGTSGGLL